MLSALSGLLSLFVPEFLSVPLGDPPVPPPSIRTEILVSKLVHCFREKEALRMVRNSEVSQRCAQAMLGPWGEAVAGNFNKHRRQWLVDEENIFWNVIGWNIGTMWLADVKKTLFETSCDYQWKGPKTQWKEKCKNQPCLERRFTQGVQRRRSKESLELEWYVFKILEAFLWKSSETKQKEIALTGLLPGIRVGWNGVKSDWNQCWVFEKMLSGREPWSKPQWKE